MTEESKNKKIPVQVKYNTSSTLVDQFQRTHIYGAAQWDKLQPWHKTISLVIFKQVILQFIPINDKNPLQDVVFC